MALQLPLPLPHASQFGRDSFLRAPSNAEALALIERWPDWPARIVVLSGPPGSGKTHLTHLWAERSGAAIIPAAPLDPAGLPHLSSGNGLAIEDVAADRVLQQPLFHLINSAFELDSSLLLTSRLPASDWQIELPDLRSRLRLATPVALEPPDDDLLRQVLVKLFSDRQLAVDKPVIDYLLLRMERSLRTAGLLVEALDREGLAAGRRITRPLAGRILAEISGEPREFTETK